MTLPPSDATSDDRLAPLLDEYLSALQAGDEPRCRAMRGEHAELDQWADSLHQLDQLAIKRPTPDQGATTTIDTGVTVDNTHAASRQLGKFELLAEAGRGGMGVVYRARQIDLGRTVALKLILNSRLTSPEDVRRFVQEARAAASIRHPHVVGIHEVGQIGGQHYFTMDFVAGQSLAQRVARGPMAPTDAARCIATVARAVDYLHSHGVIHRDLKPSNILLDERGEPLVTDFGLAKFFESDDSATRTGLILGTPSYMAPEQARGRVRDITPQTDVYGLGAVLYELLTGRPPFREPTQLDTIMQVLEGEPPLPRSIVPRIPVALERICLHAMEKSPQRRYRSAAALADDLERLLRDEPIAIPPASVKEKIRRWSRREPALSTHAGGILTVIAIITANYILRRPDLSLFLEILAALVVWLAASVVCQRLLGRPEIEAATRYAWGTIDVLLLTVILYLTGPPLGPLVGGYAVLVAASGLWLDGGVVWLTGALSTTAYLALSAVMIDPDQPWHFRLMYAAGLVIVTTVVQFLVARIRGLSRYFERYR